jgi:hypothetical protein
MQQCINHNRQTPMPREAHVQFCCLGSCQSRHPRQPTCDMCQLASITAAYKLLSTHQAHTLAKLDSANAKVNARCDDVPKQHRAQCRLRVM